MCSPVQPEIGVKSAILPQPPILSVRSEPVMVFRAETSSSDSHQNSLSDSSDSPSSPARLRSLLSWSSVSSRRLAAPLIKDSSSIGTSPR